MIINENWDKVLKLEYETTYFKNIGSFLYSERQKGILIEPENKDYFKGLKLINYEDVNIVICGKEVYNNGDSDGLAFSCNENTQKLPQALKIIFDAVEESIYGGFKLEQDWNLDRWSKQGILLLNTVLSCEKNKANSHAHIGWQTFIKSIFLHLEARKQPTIYLLLGREAQTMIKFPINQNTHILNIENPIASIMNNRKWEYNDCFKKVNNYLTMYKKTKIEW